MVKRRGQDKIERALEREFDDSERMLARKKVRRRRLTSVLLFMALIGTLAALVMMSAKNIVRTATDMPAAIVPEYQIKAEIVDESGLGRISGRMKEYIAQLEQDFADENYKIKRATIPTGMSRTLYIDLEGIEWYFKVSLDRGTSVAVEDAIRMMNYLEKNALKPKYVDLRIAGKAYFML